MILVFARMILYSITITFLTLENIYLTSPMKNIEISLLSFWINGTHFKIRLLHFLEVPILVTDINVITYLSQKTLTMFVRVVNTTQHWWC